MRRIDLTEGGIAKPLILFAIPIMLGSVLQQLYNAIDAIIVGNYVGRDALAAVGSTGTIVNMVIAFFVGMSMGAGVLVSQYTGARDRSGLQNTVHTAVLLSVIMGIALSVAGMLITPTLLRWMSTPEEIFPGAAEYLRIFFAGMTTLTVYNTGTGILTASGDSRRPLYFLAVSAVVNVVGNLVTVIAFDMGIAGVAWSTVVSQGISAALVIITLCRSQTDFALDPRRIRLHMPTLSRIIQIGLPGGIQQSIISVSNIAVQAYINGLGPAVVAGNSASGKIDSFIQLPTASLAVATATFVGQNLGAHKVDRARKGTLISLYISIAATIALAGVALLFGRGMLRAFTPDPEVITTGYDFMLVYATSYFILCFTQVLPGALRGAGDVRFATFVSIVSFVGLRQVYLYFVTQRVYTVTSVALGYPFTWAVVAIALLIYYFKFSNWDSYREKTETQE